MQNKNQNIWAILGPTATGKTDLACNLASKLQAETKKEAVIVNVDSAAIYKEFDIGVAKPSQKQRQQVPHYLIDIQSIWQNYSVANFVADTLALVENLEQEGKQIILAGGTMLYFNALEKPLASLPAVDSALYDDLVEQWEQDKLAVFKQLQKLDLAISISLNQNDKQRVLRALSVCLTTGKKFSELQKNRSTTPLLKFKKIALIPEDRGLLKERIDLRFLDMLDKGLLAEIKELQDKEVVTLDFINSNLSASKIVGYKEAFEHLSGKISYEEFKARSQAASRQLAKRQLTWLRSMTDLFKLDPFSFSEQELLNKSYEYLCKE